MKILFGYVMTAILGAALFWAGTQITAKSVPNSASWQLVYAHSETGESLVGTKTVLVDAVRSGKKIRVYFRGRRVEHLADAGFITVFGDEIFAQIAPIETQSPSLNPTQIRFRDPGVRWRAILSTSGKFTAFADGKEPNIRSQAVKWYVQD